MLLLLVWILHKKESRTKEQNVMMDDYDMKINPRTCIRRHGWINMLHECHSIRPDLCTTICSLIIWLMFNIVKAVTSELAGFGRDVSKGCPPRVCGSTCQHRSRFWSSYHHHTRRRHTWARNSSWGRGVGGRFSARPEGKDPRQTPTASTYR